MQVKHFERRWCGPTDLTSEAAKESAAEFDGLVLHCFGNEREPPALPSTIEDGKPIVLCYAACEDQIRDLVLEAAAAKAILHKAPERVHDGVARKEARF